MSQDKNGYARETFSTKAKVYRGRPEWPDSVYDVMLSKTGFNPLDKRAMQDLVAVDVGAGTGKTTFPLADLGCTVIAVEPNADMRKKLEEKKAEGGYDNVIIVDGDALNLNLPAAYAGKVNLFYAGNAAHWWGSQMRNNDAGLEKQAIANWQSYAAPDAKISIMFLRAEEKDPYVRELNDIMCRHFEQTRNSSHKPCTTEMFEAGAFKNYFNGKARRKPQDTYGNIPYHLQDYDHFKEWLLSHSYFPNDGFENKAAAKDLKEFYDRAVERGQGTANVSFGIRLYTGALSGVPTMEGRHNWKRERPYTEQRVTA